MRSRLRLKRHSYCMSIFVLSAFFSVSHASNVNSVDQIQTTEYAPPVCVITDGGPRPFPKPPFSDVTSIIFKNPNENRELFSGFSPMWGKICANKDPGNPVSVTIRFADNKNVSARVPVQTCMFVQAPQVNAFPLCPPDTINCPRFSYTAVRRCGPGGKPEIVEEPYFSHAYSKFDSNPMASAYFRQPVIGLITKLWGLTLVSSTTITSMEICRAGGRFRVIASLDPSGTTQDRVYQFKNGDPCKIVQGRHLRVEINADEFPGTSPVRVHQLFTYQLSGI